MAEPAHGGADAGAVGMPQLDFATFPSQIFWLIVALVALYYILSRSALPRIAGAIEERHDAIEDDLDRAAEFKRRAMEAEKALEAATAAARAKAQAIAAAARAEAQTALDEALAKADAQISERTAESEKRIAAIRDSARDSVRSVAVDAAEALVEAFAPGVADRDAVTRAVDQRMGA